MELLYLIFYVVHLVILFSIIKKATFADRHEDLMIMQVRLLKKIAEKHGVDADEIEKILHPKK